MTQGRADNAYDEIPYPGGTFSEAHPDRLATVAILMGMDPVPPESCRVLELGCGDGSHLVPMGLVLPEAELIGVDYSERAVADANELARATGVDNVRFIQADVRELPADLGEHDYVIAHGLYSWVPAEVREAVLAACRRDLSRRGVAYVSHLAYPGAHFRALVRDIMRLHVRQFPDRARKARQALAVLRFIADAQPEDDPYRLVLEQEIDRIGLYPAEVLLHDELADDSHPVWLTDLVADAARHGLAYIGDAKLRVPTQVTPEVERVLPPDPLQREQYVDLLCARRFRRTLFRRDDAVVTQRSPRAGVRRLLASAATRPQGEVDLAAGATAAFELPTGEVVESEEPAEKAVLEVLGAAWPGRVPFADVRGELSSRKVGVEDEALADLLLQLCRAGVIGLHAFSPPVAREPAERPVVSPVARHQLPLRPRVSSLLHEGVDVLDPLSRALVPLLDGSRDRAALVAELKTASAQDVDESLVELAYLGLLLA